MCWHKSILQAEDLAETFDPTPSEIFLDIDWFDADFVYDDIIDNYEIITGDIDEFFD